MENLEVGKWFFVSVGEIKKHNVMSHYTPNLGHGVSKQSVI